MTGRSETRDEGGDVAVIITAHNEAQRVTQTIAAIVTAFPACRLVLADDCSTDATAKLAEECGCEVVSASRRVGKGGAATLAGKRLLDGEPPKAVVFADADLGHSAKLLPRLARALEEGPCDLCVAVFATSEGGGFSIALGFARACLRALTGLSLRSPICGQRALRGDALDAVIPFAGGFGMEIGMTVDAHRAGLSICEQELDLSHRDTGKDLRGFLHRARQLGDFARVFYSRL